ncbi:MAG: LamG domain-containing protein, partial [Sedimentisphaerales bacterium]|nr:LamG domain-containing protein [Sedimentisphaerales bacterium]
SEAVSKLSPSTSKLVLVNVGGGIHVADAFLTATYKNPQNPAHKTILQLAQTFDKTSIQLGTDERINNFNVRLSIDQLPPLDSLFPVLMQLSQTDLTAKAMATKPQPRDGITIGITTASELKWKSGVNAKSHKIYFGTNAGQLPLLAEVKNSSYDELPTLEEDSKYYWRVDEVWADGTLITGDVWDFTIGNIVGWWKFDGDANDSSSKGNNGTEIGDPTYVAGKIGQAISFDGDGDRIEVPATVAGNPELFPAKAISTSAWVKTTVSANGLYSLVRHEFHFTPLQAFAGGAHAAAFTDRNGSRVLRQTSFDWSKINDGKWHHCAVTYNNGVHEVWIDGTKEVSNNFGPFPLWTGDDQPWVFGGKERGEYYPGELDDVRIYNYALSEGEITALYNEAK